MFELLLFVNQLRQCFFRVPKLSIACKHINFYLCISYQILIISNKIETIETILICEWLSRFVPINDLIIWQWLYVNIRTRNLDNSVGWIAWSIESHKALVAIKFYRDKVRSRCCRSEMHSSTDISKKSESFIVKYLSLCLDVIYN